MWFNSCMVVVSCFASFAFTLRSHKMVFGSCGIWKTEGDGASTVQVRGFACEPGCRLHNLDFVYQGAGPWLLHQI